MPFSLGFWAAAGASVVAAPAYELISTVILSSNTSTVTFSSIDQTYKHLQIRGVARSTFGNTTSGLGIGINGVTSAVYSSHLLLGNGSTVSSTNYTGQAPSYLTQMLTGNSATTSAFGAFITDILDYTNTSKNRTMKTFAGSGNPNYVALASGNNFSTTTVTSVSFSSPDGGLLVAGTRISLYGVRG